MPNFFLVKDIHDVITHAKFGDDRLRGLGVVAGQISAFSIDFAGRPYNTLTLPCERVIWNELGCKHWAEWVLFANKCYKQLKRPWTSSHLYKTFDFNYS